MLKLEDLIGEIKWIIGEVNKELEIIKDIGITLIGIDNIEKNLVIPGGTKMGKIKEIEKMISQLGGNFVAINKDRITSLKAKLNLLKTELDKENR